MLPTQPGWAPGTFTRHRTPRRPVTPSRHERMNLRPGCALGSLTGSQVAFSSIRQVPGQHQEIALASLCWGKKKKKNVARRCSADNANPRGPDPRWPPASRWWCRHRVGPSAQAGALSPVVSTPNTEPFAVSNFHLLIIESTEEVAATSLPLCRFTPAKLRSGTWEKPQKRVELGRCMWGGKPLVLRPGHSIAPPGLGRPRLRNLRDQAAPRRASQVSAPVRALPTYEKPRPRGPSRVRPRRAWRREAGGPAELGSARRLAGTDAHPGPEARQLACGGGVCGAPMNGGAGSRK